ncbi:dynein heavy chain family protein [Holotrichia oblita]|uniref:Dynein heavy chain family protein n=1 Tax=Holotrichia oblita TaxID=644536 RepID=A0ACB9TRH4_HOLOL|nr:dynein heavy chain family protein [Holotrichia oblita]
MTFVVELFEIRLPLVGDEGEADPRFRRHEPSDRGDTREVPGIGYGVPGEDQTELHRDGPGSGPDGGGVLDVRQIQDRRAEGGRGEGRHVAVQFQQHGLRRERADDTGPVGEGGQRPRAVVPGALRRAVAPLRDVQQRRTTVRPRRPRVPHPAQAQEGVQSVEQAVRPVHHGEPEHRRLLRPAVGGRRYGGHHGGTGGLSVAAMKDRHWKRMAKVTGYLFDVESPTFTLRNVMEAPLLQFKDDVEGIDKSWVKIMTRAHEIPNAVECCTGDETMGQLLPHLLEQLETCQKSLTGYLGGIQREPTGPDRRDAIELGREDTVREAGDVHRRRRDLAQQSADRRQGYGEERDRRDGPVPRRSRIRFHQGVHLVLRTGEMLATVAAIRAMIKPSVSLGRPGGRADPVDERGGDRDTDIFDDIVKLKVRTPIDFEWQKQERFYYYEETDDVIVRITDVIFIYQNEYLGITERLAITPLTDRCYITLAQAIWMNMGGAPAGPAGTGKTETTKDMGRSLGKLVVVFNCSDQMDFRGLGRIFKRRRYGYDEHRVRNVPDDESGLRGPARVAGELEDPIPFGRHDGAGQADHHPRQDGLVRFQGEHHPGEEVLHAVQTVRGATLETGALRFRPEEYPVGVANVGRSETKPPHRYGGDHSHESAERHELEQIGRRGRAAVPVVDRGHVPRREAVDALVERPAEGDIEPDGGDEPGESPVVEPEDRAAVRDVAGASRIDGVGADRRRQNEMHALPDEVDDGERAAAQGTPHEPEGDHGAADVRPAGRRHERLDGRHLLHAVAQDVEVQEDRLLLVRKRAVRLVLDGPVDAVWIENLNSVLDDNKTLTLANGDRIVMAPNCKLVFEPDNVDNASPATISRMGMVFISASALPWGPILESWLKTRSQQEADTLRTLFGKIYDDLHSFVQIRLKPKMFLREAIYIRQCYDVLQGILDCGDENSNCSPFHTRTRHLTLYLFAFFHIAVVVVVFVPRRGVQRQASGAAVHLLDDVVAGRRPGAARPRQAGGVRHRPVEVGLAEVSGGRDDLRVRRRR